MRIEILSIGDELLKGAIVNTNAAYLSKMLQSAGYEVMRETTVSDAPEVLKSAVKEAFERADVVISTGGLGPTLDDHTREIAAEFFESDFVRDPLVADDLLRRFGPELASLEDQARVPRKAKVLLNPIGTAPALVFSDQGKMWILLPGVPYEMQAFCEGALREIFPQDKQKHICEIYFSILYESHVDPELRRLSSCYPSVEVGIYPSLGYLRILLKGPTVLDVEDFKGALIQKFAPYHYEAPHGKIEEALLMWFVQNKKTLSIAESCTGGMIASQITAIPGASDYFLGGFVSYSNALKTQMLGVSGDLITQEGAVSKAVVAAMLEGIFSHTSADYGISVSGIAGPTGGTPDKPIGTVWAAIGERGKEADIGVFLAKGDRQKIIQTTSQFLLGALYRKVSKGTPAFPLLV
ncbi:MAG: nicotinamide-nucleotide amidohydrolase family protein [Verrucomicrobia bacterium]|nr:nicotinamide-nucleotide amidohydrolase family protein [Verrucomicrobiota bacterium]